MARVSPVPAYNIDFPEYEFREFPKMKYHPEMEPVTVSDEYEERELGSEWGDTPFFPRMRYHRIHGSRRVLNSAEQLAITPEDQGWRDQPFVSPTIGKRPVLVDKNTDAEYAAFRAWRAQEMGRQAEARREAVRAAGEAHPQEPMTAAADDAAERETLIGEAHLHDVRIDKRWSTAKIREAIAAHQVPKVPA